MKDGKEQKWWFFWRSRSDNITTIPLVYAVFLLALPAALRLLGHFLFEIIDAYWLGKLGKDALAAVGGSSLYIWSYYSLMLITITGTNTLVSQAIGSKKEGQALHIAAVALGSSLLWSIVFATIYFIGEKHMLIWLGLTDIALAHAHEYFMPFIWASPIYYLWCLLEEIINARGQTQITLWIMLLAIGSNIILDPLLIHGYGPFPQWGVFGAQIASIIAASIGLLASLCVCLHRRYIGKPGFDRTIFIKLIKIGFPRMTSSLIFCIVYVGLAHLIQDFGAEALAAWMICHRLEGFAYHLSMGFSTSTAVMVGQFIGAGKPDQVAKAVWYNMTVLSVIIAINVWILLTMGKSLLQQFTINPKVLEYGVGYLMIVAYTHIFLGWELVLGGAFSGMGNTAPHFYLVAPLTILRLPVSYFLIPWLGIHGVFWAISLTTLLKGIGLWLLFLSMVKCWQK